MSTTELQLKSSCGECGSTTDLYGSNCKHMTLCLTCGKTMAENRANCGECGVTITRFIQEYSDENYFDGRFMTGLPDFSKKKSAENKCSLQKEGLHGRQVSDTLRDDDDDDSDDETKPSIKDVGSSTTASRPRPVSEKEIWDVILQKTPVSTQDLVAKFKARIRSSEDKQAFAEILKRISKIIKTANSTTASGSVNEQELRAYLLQKTQVFTTTASGPVSEQEIRAYLLQKTRVTTHDLVAKFKARISCSEDKQAFTETLKRTCKIVKTANSSFVVLRDR